MKLKMIKNKVYYAKANYGHSEISAVNKVLRHQRLNLMNSNNVKSFEKKLPKFLIKNMDLWLILAPQLTY